MILIILGAIIIIVLLALCQIYLAAAQQKAWGLILPAIFALMFIYAVLGLNILPVDIIRNVTGRVFFIVLGLLGIAGTLLLYRKGKLLQEEKELRRQKYKEMRRLELQRREAINKGKASANISAGEADDEETLLRRKQYEEALELRRQQQEQIDDSRKVSAFSKVGSRTAAAVSRSFRRMGRKISNIFASKK